MKRSLCLLVCWSALLVCVAAQDKPAKAAGEKAMKPATQMKAAAPNKQATIREALSAAPADIAKNATVKDWDGNVLKQGTGAYTCFPAPPSMKGVGPMCLDAVWQSWSQAWMQKKDVNITGVGIAYMLQGDGGVSNIDPYATAKTPDNQWVVSGPHTMVLVPDKSALDAMPTDPNNGGPFVMWKGTPYAHIMVPIGKKPAGGAAMAKPAAKMQ